MNFIYDVIILKSQTFKKNYNSLKTQGLYGHKISTEAKFEGTSSDQGDLRNNWVLIFARSHDFGKT